MPCCSIHTLKAIVEEVARRESRNLEVRAVMPGEAHGAYAEVLVANCRPGSSASRLLIGVARDLPEDVIRQTFADQLRALL
jgi:hypothetical protein